jgi:hypothetical protein
MNSLSLTCTNNFVYLLSSSANNVLSFTPKGLVDNYLFKEDLIGCMAGDPDTNLLYFHGWKKIFIANEQGKVLQCFSCLDPVSKIFVSCNFLLVLYNAQLSSQTDYRVGFHGHICLVYNQGIVVTLQLTNEINLWRVM